MAGLSVFGALGGIWFQAPLPVKTNTISLQHKIWNLGEGVEFNWLCIKSVR